MRILDFFTGDFGWTAPLPTWARWLLGLGVLAGFLVAVAVDALR